MSHHVQREIRYNFEFDNHIKACFIGAGGHAYRNVYPALRYAPVELLGICDLDIARAAKFAKLFGAEMAYSDHHEMLAKEKPDLVFLVTAYHPDGRVQATDLALDALKAGCHVWMEKPTAASAEEIERLMSASAAAGRMVMTGLKKTFFPTIEKLKDLVGSPEFGRLTSINVRYPQSLPAPTERGDLVKMQSFLDHIYHPGSILNFLGGEIERASYEWEPGTGATVTNMRFRSGAIGTLHLAAGQSGGSMFERVEIIGEGANAVVENGSKLTYFRKAALPSYGRAASFIQPDANAALVYEPEHSLGQLYNNNLFYLGYVPEILHLTDAIQSGRPITKGTLEVAREIMKLFAFYRSADAGVTTNL
ncbi:putative dehydrogenase [Neorhizobium sp. R1-B]|uniref:Gfo/Idh/MocA family protein n=1 Tax=unclassified Neorhizobium TaxID=2629175 RepID=UPI001049C9DA|nr:MULTISPECIES: Gfo/Idh/MocA family oxidoreductase [unclassified Neorhizobium]TCV73774.1 putative dehydrogenase [Neorhizobium sp. S3-V5DH]TDX85489.1 putative dehydrogenase [Neorhizobium sp. R1-B]